jgi:multiple sugar transport system permease protein
MQPFIIDIFVWVFLIIATLFILAPFVFMFTASAMPANDIMKMPYRWIPKGFYWQNFWQGIRGNDGSFIYLRNILNSLIVASTVTATHDTPLSHCHQVRVPEFIPGINNPISG